MGGGGGKPAPPAFALGTERAEKGTSLDTSSSPPDVGQLGSIWRFTEEDEGGHHFNLPYVSFLCFPLWVGAVVLHLIFLLSGGAFLPSFVWYYQV